MDKIAFNLRYGTYVDSFHFNEEAQTIEVVIRTSSREVYATNPPRPVPDEVWKETYGIKEGKLVLLEKRQGRHIPRSINPERITFEEEK